jgi:hypothetical protein
MVFNATFNNISVISWQLVLLVEETGVPGVNLELAELVFIIGQILPNTHLYCKSLLFCFVYLDLVKSIYLSVSDIYCHSLFCLWVVSPLQCRSSILVFILFIYVICVTNHQNHCKCKMQMSVILCSHRLLDWFNKTILF